MLRSKLNFKYQYTPRYFSLDENGNFNFEINVTFYLFVFDALKFSLYFVLVPEIFLVSVNKY